MRFRLLTTAMTKRNLKGNLWVLTWNLSLFWVRISKNKSSILLWNVFKKEKSQLGRWDLLYSTKITLIILRTMDCLTVLILIKKIRITSQIWWNLCIDTLWWSIKIICRWKKLFNRRKLKSKYSIQFFKSLRRVKD